MLILSLFDRTGNWPKPYAEAGHAVITYDLGSAQFDGVDYMYTNRRHIQGGINNWKSLLRGIRPDIILAAPPCTDFASSGARWWFEKDNDGRTLISQFIIDDTLELIEYFKPRCWALENPVGRLPTLFPEVLGKPKLIFNPCDYAGYLDSPEVNAYTKKTCLWGKFNIPVQKPVDPQKVCPQGSWIQKLGGKSERTKFLRSMTPMGFAKAFYETNHEKKNKNSRTD